MPGSRVLVAIALGLLSTVAAGCSSDSRAVRIGLLTDCQGPLYGYEDAQLSGAELPFLHRGARLVGTGPSDGVTAIEVGGRRVVLVHGCQETGEHTVYIEEARRLLETEQVDVLIGGATVVARDLAHRYPEVPFVSTFWNEQEVTLRRPAANLFRFSPDYAQQVAGLGSYAYRDLGWRRAAVVAGDGPPGWAGAAAFAAEFCALGGKVVTTAYRSPFTGKPDVVTRSLAVGPDGVAAFLGFLDDPVAVLAPLATRLGDSRRLLVSGLFMEDPALMKILGPGLDGVVGTTWLPSAPPSPVLRDYRRRYKAAYPGVPAQFGSQSWVIGYHNAVEATLSALERLESSDVRSGLMAELARLRLELPDGETRLDGNRQAVRDTYLSRVRSRQGRTTFEPVGVAADVEQTFSGILSEAPPPGPGTQPCKRARPPAWAR